MRTELEKAVQLIQRKDARSLEEALALLQNTVFSFSMRVCGQRQDAEDTMQEVLIKSVPTLPKFDSPKALMVWLYKVAKTRCLMSRRRSKFSPKEALSLEELMPDRRELESLSRKAGGTPESAYVRRESARRVREAVRKLPTDYRLILVLHDMEELSNTDIAEITGLRLGTIRVRLHRARLFVRMGLAKQQGRLDRRRTVKDAAVAPAQPRDGRCKKMFAQLSNYLDDELDDSLCEELEKHMNSCEPCQTFLASLERSIEQCRTATSETPDPRLAAKLRQRILTEYQNAMANASRHEAGGLNRR